MALPEQNPYAHQSDLMLVQLSAGGLGAHSVEMMRRLKETLEAEMRAANTLSEKIHRLNLSLLAYTIAIAAIAAFQFGAWLWDLTR
jgi:hypothetical protein